MTPDEGGVCRACTDLPCVRFAQTAEILNVSEGGSAGDTVFTFRAEDVETPDRSTSFSYALVGAHSFNPQSLLPRDGSANTASASVTTVTQDVLIPAAHVQHRAVPTLRFNGVDGFVSVADTLGALALPNFALVFDLRQSSTSPGYIFALTDQAGFVRYLALFSSPTDGMTLYYTAGQDRQSARR